jgi:hypothetical protein
MFKQIIVAMAGAIAAQITAATLDFTPGDKHEHFDPRPAATVQFAAVPGTAEGFLVRPTLVSTVVPFLGAPQIVNR